eukprot:XP_011415814.1 PREDICTED: uncharacterized protein LOC105319815 isoform X3 [Crassostrea gigas]
MAHQTIFEDPSEEFVDCTDEFLDKVIEECLAVPSDDHFSDAESLKTCETDGSACEESTKETTEHDEAEVSANTEASVSADKEADVSDTEGTEKNHGGDKDKLMENETKLAEESDTQDNRGYLQDLLGLLVELEKRFEHFTAEIGDLVQLGALSAKHAARIEQYARCVQNTYLSMKADNEKMQDYLQIKETDWVQTQAQLHNEIVRQTEEIQALMTELSKSNMKNRIRNNMQDRHLNLVRKDSHSTEDIVTLMLHQRCSIEKAMALDFSRQSKINELKLLVLQQQSYIQKLELQNKEMDMVLQGLLFPADEPKEPPKEYENICPLSDPISMVSDVLCCDQALYVIDKSTDCSLVSEQIFQIGESSRPVSHSEGVFDPQRLSYVRREMREHEVPDTQSPIARDLGSGESGVVDSIAQEQECAVEDSKRKLQEPDEPSSFEEIKNIVKIQEAKITPLQI